MYMTSQYIEQVHCWKRKHKACKKRLTVLIEYKYMNKNNVYPIPQTHRDMLVFLSLVFALESEAKIVQLPLYDYRLHYKEMSHSS